MAKVILTSQGSGKTIYIIIRQTSTGYVWNDVTRGFVVWSDSDIANYAIHMSDKSGDLYTATFPSTIQAGQYTINYYLMAGTDPDITDLVLETYTDYWNGVAFTPVPPSTIPPTPAVNNRPANTFNINDRVYVVESAKRGFIESYIVSKIELSQDGYWKYIIGIPQKPPTVNQTVGDRNTLHKSRDLVFYEDELTTFCNALELAESAVLSQYNRIRALREARCNGSSSGSV